MLALKVLVTRSGLIGTARGEFLTSNDAIGAARTKLEERKIRNEVQNKQDRVWILNKGKAKKGGASERDEETGS